MTVATSGAGSNACDTSHNAVDFSIQAKTVIGRWPKEWPPQCWEGSPMPWIKVIEPEDATGELKQEYDNAAKRAGKVFHILKVQS